MLIVPPGDWSLEPLELPAAEPLTRAQAKLHLRVPDDVTEFDTLIDDYIAAARSYIEETFGLPVLKQKVRLRLAQFPRADRIRLPIWPVQSVDAARYITTDGVAHDLTVGDSETVPTPDVLTRLWRKPAELVVPWAKIWPPAVLQMADAVQFDLTVGFVSGASPELRPLPPVIPQAMRLLIGHSYENGSAITLGTLMKSDPIALGVADLLSNVRLRD